MRSLTASVVIVGLYGIAVGTAGQAITGEPFQPVKVTVDLSHADQRPLLEGPWAIRPDARFPGVMAARDQGQPVSVAISLPKAETYQSRWKFKFDRPDQALDVQINGTVVATIRPSRTGKAEKVRAVIPARAVVAGVNHVTFVNRGTPGGTEYELIRLQNYQAVLVKGQAYLLPRAAGDAAPSRRAGWLFGLAAALAAVAVAAGAAWLMARLTGRTWAAALAAERILCAPLLVWTVFGVVPMVAPYRVICTAAFFWQLVGITLAAGHALLIMGWSAHCALRKLASLDPAAGVDLVTGALGQSRRLSKTGAVLAKGALGEGWRVTTMAGKGTVAGLALGARLMGLGLRRGWEWFLRQQYPQGYAKIFCYIAAVALFSHWVFHWEQFAEVSGYLAGVALVIAVVWESLVSLEEDE